MSASLHSPSSLDHDIAALLAEHAFYQVHLRLMLKNAAVQQAIADYEIARRHVQADSADVLTLLGTINRAQSTLVQACKTALAPYPNLQAKLNGSHLQLVVVDALCAMARG